MGHQRHADRVSDLERYVERHRAGATGRMGADAHLDADDNVAIGVRDLDRIQRRQQADFLALSDHHASRIGKDAGEGHVQIGKDTHRAGLDHMLAETRKVPGAGAAGVNRRRDS